MFDSLLHLHIRLTLLVSRVIDREEGQGLTEYALLLSLIAIVAITAVKVYGGKVTSVLSTVASSV